MSCITSVSLHLVFCVRFVEYRRKDCLRQLLVTLCERGDLQTLVGFPYIDLQDEVSFFLL